MSKTENVQYTINTLLKKNGVLRISDLREELGEERFCRVERQVYNILKRLQDSNAISRIGNGNYTSKSVHPPYSPSPSQQLKEVGELVKERFPLIDIQIWELTLMNEFVNHLIGNNVLFVEVEKEMEDVVFQELFTDYPQVLLMPDINEFYQYYSPNMIVVQRLVSGAPRAIDGIYASLEKLLVDLFSTKLTGKIINRGDYPEMLENIFENYGINEAAMLRYAKRRKVDIRLKDYLSEHTSVRLSYEEN